MIRIAMLKRLVFKKVVKNECGGQKHLFDVLLYKSVVGNFGIMEIILLDDALKLLARVDKFGRPVPVALTAISLDIARKTGGQRIHYSQAVLCKPGSTGKKNFNYRNNTINIKGLGNNEVRSIHPILITHIDGKEVGI